MRRYAGAGCLALGILLSGLGLDSGESLTSRLSRFFVGWRMDGLMLAAGVLSVIVGVYLWHHSRESAPDKK